MSGSRRRRVDAVIFDIGGVLLEYDFNIAIRAAAPLAKLSIAEVRQRLFGGNDYASMERDKEVEKFERGLISERQFHACVEKLLNCRLPFDFFCNAWNSVFIREITPTVKVLRRLLRRRNLKVGMLSNTNALHFNFIRRRWPLFNEVPHVYVSHEIGCRKPDAETYQYVLRDLEVPPAQAVFVDDLLANVAGAQAVGMQGVHAPDPPAVRAGLAALGLAEMDCIQGARQVV